VKQRRANIFGLGLIGGSLAAALTARGWHVTGNDLHPDTEEEALRLGLVAARGIDADAELSFVATPVSSVADQVRRALETTQGLVTDVGGVKAHIVREITDPRFVAGHPMAGSELVGLAGADASLFEGAVWVLTQFCARCSGRKRTRSRVRRAQCGATRPTGCHCQPSTSSHGSHVDVAGK